MISPLLLKFLIYISYSYSIPIGQPLEKQIKLKNHKVKWFADRQEGFDKIKNKTNCLHSIEGAVKFKPDIVLVITNEVPSFISGLKVQVFHGFNAQKRPNKKFTYSHFKVRGHFDLYCTQGPSTTKPFQKLAQKYKFFKIKETGWSKMDPLFSEEIEKPEANIILITSTFTKSLSLAYDDFFYHKISSLIKKKSFKFIMTTHPKMDRKVIRKWQLLNGSYFQHFDTFDLIPLYKKASLMISDTTSAVQEFLMLKRPIITINNPNDFGYTYNIKTIENLENALKNPSKWYKKIESNLTAEINKIHPYTDGKSSQRVIEASLNLLKSNQKKPKKPLNLLRNLKMRKDLGYWKVESS